MFFFFFSLFVLNQFSYLPKKAGRCSTISCLLCLILVTESTGNNSHVELYIIEACHQRHWSHLGLVRHLKQYKKLSLNNEETLF